MENNNFNELIQLIRYNKQFNNILKQRQEEYLIKLYKISELNEEIIIELYNTMKKKFYYKRKNSNQQYWYQNQLRIFIYLLFAYLESFSKQIYELVKQKLIQKQEDWNYFSVIFNYKKAIFFQFQVMSIIKTSTKAVTWSLQEIQLLKQIIEQKKMKNRWNSIARELFIRSSKRFFRNPKQCRQRWMNHLDPSKIRTEWTIQEDFILLNSIKKKGKKWSTAVKQLNNTRTQHMVKNRYKSLIYNQGKKQPAGKRQSQLETIIIKRISKTLNKCKKSNPLKIEENEQVKIKQCFFEKNYKNSNQLEQGIKIQEIEKKQNLQNLFKNDQFQMLQQIDNADHFSDQFYQNSPVFIPWRMDMGINYGKEMDLDSEDKILIEENIGESNIEDNQNFFKA